MKLNQIRIVLVGTTHPGNIGSTARAMKTMGLHSLYLVSPRIFPDQKAHEMAAGADDILEKATVVSSLREAICDCQQVIGTSARSRHISLPILLPAQSAKLIGKMPQHAQVAFVFGREHAGLTNDELLQCHYHLTIPSDPAFSSLNLAQAVQIIAYELRMQCINPSESEGGMQELPATIEEVEQFYTHLREVLITIDFLKLSNPKRLFQRLRRLFNRIQLEHTEVNMLRGILSHMQWALKRSYHTHRT